MFGAQSMTAAILETGPTDSDVDITCTTRISRFPHATFRRLRSEPISWVTEGDGSGSGRHQHADVIEVSRTTVASTASGHPDRGDGR
jgi:hypothetical protein